MFAVLFMIMIVFLLFCYLYFFALVVLCFDKRSCFSFWALGGLMFRYGKPSKQAGSCFGTGL